LEDREWVLFAQSGAEGSLGKEVLIVQILTVFQSRRETFMVKVFPRGRKVKNDWYLYT